MKILLFIFIMLTLYSQFVSCQYEGIFGKDKNGNVQFFKTSLPSWINNVDTNSFSNISISKISSLVAQEDCSKCVDQVCENNRKSTLCSVCELKYVYICNNNKNDEIFSLSCPNCSCGDCICPKINDTPQNKYNPPMTIESDICLGYERLRMLSVPFSNGIIHNEIFGLDKQRYFVRVELEFFMQSQDLVFFEFGLNLINATTNDLVETVFVYALDCMNQPRSVCFDTTHHQINFPRISSPPGIVMTVFVNYAENVVIDGVVRVYTCEQNLSALTGCE